MTNRASRASALRAAGAALLGLVGGVLAAIVLQDLLATAFPHEPWTVPLHALLLPVLAVGGAALGVALDRRARSGS